jgi:hypothetical protein
MPNPVAVNDLSPISGSLQTSRISYAVETAGKDYGQDYNGTTWYSDIPQNGSQYTIISDNYTANYYVSRSNAEGAYVEGGLPAVDEYSAPVFWLTAGTSSLDIITIVNGLPDRRGQIPFNSGSQALNWIISSSNYFAVGPPYEQIDADQLRSFYHANQIISYPTTQSSWYDISGYGNNGTLINGVGFDSATGTLVFDGVDDGINLTNNFSGSTENSVTVECIVKLDTNQTARIFASNYTQVVSPTGFGIGIDDSVTNKVKWFTGNLGTTNTLTSTTTLTNGRYYHTVGTYNGSNKILYINSVSEASTTLSNAINNTSTLASIGYLRGLNIQYLDGNIENVKFYSKALSAADVAQNYYGGPVVTGSISGSYYANNLVSYVSGSINTYNLSANIISGSLQNGVGFSPLNGGYWSFDGSDDRILLEGSTTNAWRLDSTPSWTVNAWIRVPNGSSTSSGLTYQGILSNTNGGPIHSVFQVANSSISYSHYNNAWFTKSGTIPVNDGNWHMLTWVNSANSMNFYVDGKFDSTVNSTMTGAGFLDVIGSSLGTAFLGDIASVQINQGKAFTAAEVLQQYNATK